jgi:endonuclease/exonuclease/phosphatase (EEP) superfamily protein YafD
VALYVPRVCFALPFPVLILLGLRHRKPGAIALTCLSGGLSLFTLMGFVVPMKPPAKSEFTFKVYTQNVASLERIGPLLSQLQTVDPDVVLLQEAGGTQSASLQAQLPEYAWYKNGPFLFGSRFQVLSVHPVWESSHIRYLVRVAGRVVTFLNIHPRSPRHAYSQILGVPSPVAPKRWRTMSFTEVVRDDAGLRTSALRGIGASVAEAETPVVVAGDSNSPGLSWAASQSLGTLTDAHAAAGLGFGYTFPDTPIPWLRLDRVFVTREISVQATQVLAAGASDHRAVLVMLGLGIGHRPEATD